MCNRCGTGAIAWCQDPNRHREAEAPTLDVSVRRPPKDDTTCTVELVFKRSYGEHSSVSNVERMTEEGLEQTLIAIQLFFASGE